MRRLLICVVILLAAGLAWARGGSEDEHGNTRLEVMMVDSARVPDGEGSLTENRWTQLVHDQMLELGISVSFVPRGASLARHTVMMATGSAPDVSLTHGRLLFGKYAMDGGLHDLGPYIDEFGPNITDVLGAELLQYAVLDGVQYGVPSRRTSVANGISLIRKDWLDALGMDPPTNRDELVTVLRAFRDEDPGGIGSQNVIPWGKVSPDPGTFFGPDFEQFDVMYSFMEHDIASNYSATWPHHDGFQEFMQWMHDLYQEGLIDREFATLNDEENNRRVVNGQVGFLHYDGGRLYGQNSGSALYTLALDNTPIEYIPVEVFQNDEGDYRKILDDPNQYFVFVPRSSDHPAQAIQYLNWMLEEETGRWMNFGIEGEHYEMVDGMPVIPDPEHTINTFLYLQRYIQILGPYPVDQEMLNTYERQTELVDFGGMNLLAEEMGLRDGFAAPYYQEGLPQLGRDGPGLVKVCERYWVKILTEDNFGANYAEFMDKLEDRDIGAIDDELADYYERNF